nr:CCR4-NOT transcription complex subunit 1-like [Ipomoea trifida]
MEAEEMGGGGELERRRWEEPEMPSHGNAATLPLNTLHYSSQPSKGNIAAASFPLFQPHTYIYAASPHRKKPFLLQPRTRSAHLPLRSAADRHPSPAIPSSPFDRHHQPLPPSRVQPPAPAISGLVSRSAVAASPRLPTPNPTSTAADLPGEHISHTPTKNMDIVNSPEFFIIPCINMHKNAFAVGYHLQVVNTEVAKKANLYVNMLMQSAEECEAKVSDKHILPSAQGLVQMETPFSVVSQLPTAASNIEEQVIINPKLHDFGMHLHFQSVLPIAMEKAIKDIVMSIMPRSVSIATQTTKELVLRVL